MKGYRSLFSFSELNAKKLETWKDITIHVYQSDSAGLLCAIVMHFIFAYMVLIIKSSCIQIHCHDVLVYNWFKLEILNAVLPLAFADDLTMPNPVMKALRTKMM